MTFKLCGVCNTEKLLSEFRKDKSAPDGYQYCCKICRRAQDKSRYWKHNTEELKAKQKSRRDRTRAIINEAKAAGCRCCPETAVYCLDFHHLYGKDYTIGGMLAMNDEKVKAEIAKCVVLCRNCHAKVHAGDICLIM